jgi:transcriptional regulator with XRE-family HTH domain
MEATPATKELPVAKPSAGSAADALARRARPIRPVLATLPSARSAESADSVLAKNLVVARVAAGITQQELADAAGISRATVAQLETGYSDPRLSTIVELAAALGVSPIFLLMGKPEAFALSAFFENPSAPLVLSDGDVAKMKRLVDTGMLKDRLRAALVGAGIARASEDAGPSAPVSAAIFSAIHPGPGTIAGVLLGRLVSEQSSS